MGGVVKTVGKIAGAIAAVAAIGTGIGAVLGGTMVLSIFGTTLAASAIAAGAGLVSGVAGMLAGGPNVPQSETHLGRLSARLDTQARRKLVLGTTAMPADIRYYEGSGKDEEYIDYILAVAAHRVRSIDQIWFEDALAWTASGGVQGEYVGYLTSVSTRLEGTAANTIAINGGARWGSDDRLTGCAYIRLRIKRTGNSDEEQSPLASGLPGRVTIVGEGMPMYDPRFDSTAGGSGPMRVADQSTWGVSTENPIIQALNVLLGWRINGKLSVGAGLPVKYINLESVITFANLCDESIALANGETQPRYRTAGAFSTDDAPMAIVAALLAGCAGDLLDSNGQLSFLIKANSLATPAVTFDDHDVVSGARWDPMGGQTNLPNIISGSFTDPGSNSLYQMVPYPSVKLPSEDGIERSAPLDLAVVENAARAERLAKQTLQRMQYPGTFTAEYNMKGMAAKVGTIVWQSYSPRGWLNKPFRVVSQRPSRSGRIALVLREEHASIYAWEAEDSAAVQPAEPVRFDPRNTGPMLLARKASETADWPKIADPEGTKPEDNATEGATVPAPGVPGGNLKDENGDPLPSGYVRNDAFSLTPAGILDFDTGTGERQEIGRVSPVDLGAAEASGLERAKEVSDRLASALLRLTSSQSQIQSRLSSAGVYVDPATGQVRIHAIEVTDEKASEALVRVSAAEAQISLSATRNYVNEQIALAEIPEGDRAALDDLIQRVSSAELVINANTAAIGTKAELVELSEVTGRVTVAEQDISALEGQIVNKVETAQFDALTTRVTTAEQEITALTDGGSITQTITAVRQVEREVDGNAETSLRALLEADKERRQRVAAQAFAQEELTARIISDVSAEATQRLALAVRVDTNAAGIVEERTARVTADGALSQRVDGLVARANNNETAITSEATARANADGALAQDIQQLSASSQSNADAIAKEAQDRIDAIAAEAAARGQALTAEQQARIDGIKAERDARIAALTAERTYTNAEITKERTARTNAVGAVATDLANVTTRVGDNEASVTTLAQSVDGVKAQAFLVISANGVVSGYKATSDGQVSTFDIVADRFRVTDPDGAGDIVPFEVSGGKVKLNAALIRSLKVAPRASSEIFMDVELAPIIVLGGNGDTVQYQGGSSFGSGIDALPRIEADLSSLPALAEGERYEPRPTNVTGSQFQPSLRKIGAGSIDSVVLGPSSFSSGSVPAHRINKPGAADAYDGYYQFRIDVNASVSQTTIEGVVFYTYVAEGDLYIRSGTALTKVGSYFESWQTSGAPGSAQRTITKTVKHAPAIGAASPAFGAHPVQGGISRIADVTFSTQGGGNAVPVSGRIPWLIYAPKRS